MVHNVRPNQGDNVIYHYFSHFESKSASPLPYAGGISTEDDQKFSLDRG